MKTPNPRFRVIPSLLLALVTSLLFVGPLAAETKTFVDKAAEQAIRGAFKKARPDLAVSTIATSEIPGLYRVEIQNGPTLYSSADGRYFVAGELFELGENGIVNVAEKRLQPMRKDMLAKISRDDMIIFSPEGETKGALYVFTDVDCGFCQKLHQEVPALNLSLIHI